MGTVPWVKTSKYSKHLTKTTTYEECLLQLFYGVTWDGDLISKQYRNQLVAAGHALKVDGWNAITEKGILFLIETGAVKS